MISQKPILAAVLLGLGVSATNSQSQEAEPTVWDVKKLEVAPQFHWIDRGHPIQSLTYTGQPFQGHDTEVFAFYASPATLGDVSGEPAKKAFPGVVLIHGGGGTAFSEWVHLWAKRG
ncbi:MAG: acylamino acid-releasing protein, partial [Verrucomicrobiae bacterium]|nr:acylamino acid-releasing protein [Verrucomicrobiae bacterium]